MANSTQYKSQSQTSQTKNANVMQAAECKHIAKYSYSSSLNHPSPSPRNCSLTEETSCLRERRHAAEEADYLDQHAGQSQRQRDYQAAISNSKEVKASSHEPNALFSTYLISLSSYCSGE